MLLVLLEFTNLLLAAKEGIIQSTDDAVLGVMFKPARHECMERPSSGRHEYHRIVFAVSWCSLLSDLGVLLCSAGDRCSTLVRH